MNAFVIEGTGHEAGTPEVAGNPSLTVEKLGIAHMERIEGPGKGPLGFGDADKVDVVGHQAVSPDSHSVAHGVFLEPVEVTAVIGLDLEDWLVVVPPLDDVVGVTDDDGAGDASHWGQATAD